MKLSGPAQASVLVAASCEAMLILQTQYQYQSHTSNTIHRAPISTSAPQTHIRHPIPSSGSLLLPPSTNFSLLANAQRNPAFRTIPLRRSRRNIRQAHTLQMEPLFLALFPNISDVTQPKTAAKTYVLILTPNHSSKANTVAQAISWLIRINNIAFVINLIEDFP